MIKKKRILIDLDRLKDVHNGLGQIALNFGKYIQDLKDDRFEFTLLVPKQYIGYFGNNVNYETISIKRRYFPYLCPDYDLWYTIHQDSSFFPSNKKTPFILTINDLNFLEDKTPSKAQKRLKRLQSKIDRCTIITAISHYTESVIRKNLDIKDKPLHVIYFGVENPIEKQAKKPSYVNSESLLLSIGVIQPKKNLMVLVEMMKYIPDNYQLILAGNTEGTYSEHIQERILQLGLENRILMPGKITDDDKYWLLSHCTALCFPSKLEGMGIPPIEAMRFGKPVFASTFSSIPEICKEHAYYWENFEPRDMANFFLKHLEEFRINPQKEHQLIEFSEQYNWKDTLMNYLDLFDQCLNK